MLEHLFSSGWFVIRSVMWKCFNEVWMCKWFCFNYWNFLWRNLAGKYWNASVTRWLSSSSRGMLKADNTVELLLMVLHICRRNDVVFWSVDSCRVQENIWCFDICFYNFFFKVFHFYKFWGFFLWFSASWRNFKIEIYSIASFSLIWIDVKFAEILWSFKVFIFYELFPGYVHGKNIQNENQMLEDMSPTTKSVRDSKTLLTEMSKFILHFINCTLNTSTVNRSFTCHLMMKKHLFSIFTLQTTRIYVGNLQVNLKLAY